METLLLDNDLSLYKQRRARRISAGLLAFIGIINLVSAITPPVLQRRIFLHQNLPHFLPRTATSITLVFSIALLFLIKGVRLGQFNAWLTSIIVLGLVMVTNLLKGFDFEEFFVTGAFLVYMIANRKYFPAPSNKSSLRKAGIILAFIFVVIVVTSMLAAAFGKNVGHHRFFHAFNRRSVGFSYLFGFGNPDFDGFAGHLFHVLILSIGSTLSAVVVWLAFRPQVHDIFSDDLSLVDQRQRVREIIESVGGDSLSYFALRDDKQYFFDGNSVIAYRVFNSVAVVSPDPIGPVEEHMVVWNHFREMVETNGWVISVIGASQYWRDIYVDDGFRAIYMGDEALVDINNFELEGKANKGLRQARNRVANHGYTTCLFDPSDMDEALVSQLRDMLTQYRKGEPERGFSMTLGRQFNIEDKGLLCSVAFDSEDVPVAFCLFVPATKVNGYSLDIMCRDSKDHVNGLIDFLLVETILELKNRGYSNLGLNFATKRSVLADENDKKLFGKAERWLLKKLSKDMQIVSLWKFNSKFHPQWIPRYIIFDTPEHLLPSAYALAKAESLDEIPIIGKKFRK